MSEERSVTRVLVVDDDEASRRLVEVALRGLDVEIHTEDDPEAVADRVRELGPAVLVLDVMMPNLDGPMVVAQLREADVELPKIVLWSALDAGRLQELGGEAGVDAVVLKIAGPAALVQEVGRLLELWQS